MSDCCHGVNDSTDCPECHNHDHLVLSSVIPTVGLLLVLTIVIIATSCWCYHHRKKRREMAIFTEKGELIVLKDDGKYTERQRPLVIRLSQLESRRHSENNNYSQSNPENYDSSQRNLEQKIQVQTSTSRASLRGSIPLTEDGYAVLEPESSMELGYSNTGSKDDTMQTECFDQNEGLISDHYEVSENSRNEHDHDYEEPYWEPANQEEELIDQLSKLGIPEILAELIELKEQLGRGQFGVVQHGIWRIRSETGYKDMDVAVKVAENGSKTEERVKFLQEAVIMGQFKNPYILQIIGIINEDYVLKIVMEIMSNGDLHHHLLSLRQKYSRDCHQEFSELGALLLSYSRQIALGMGYLSLKQYVHRDLAARNILVSENGICKIADFGLSRDLQRETFYMSHGGKIPVKWTAPEALHYRKYSTASDVWSYGCLLYEIWSLGYKPFYNISNTEAIQKISSGYRLPPPPGCPRTIYQIMITCWHPDPSLRHHISDITVALQQPDFQILSWMEEAVTGISEEARLLGSPLEEGHCLYKDLQNTYSLQ